MLKCQTLLYVCTLPPSPKGFLSGQGLVMCVRLASLVQGSMVSLHSPGKYKIHRCVHLVSSLLFLSSFFSLLFFKTESHHTDLAGLQLSNVNQTVFKFRNPTSSAFPSAGIKVVCHYTQPGYYDVF